MASAIIPATTSTVLPLVVNIPIVNQDMVKKAFTLLTNRRVKQSEEHFLISTETIDHADMKEYSELLCEQYKDADKEVHDYLVRLHLNKEGTQVAKAIIVGTKNEFSISLIAVSRQKINGNDEHKILIASMKKKVQMSATWNLFATLFGIPTQEQKELENIVCKLNNEDSKKCLEAMVLQALGEKIQQFMGSNVEVRFIEK
ncbi:hypothetical protein I4U23_022656 [Adineta vaga]|nr:hypothetical protein I4U23_022656 [Adineta vaga]